MSVDPDQTPRSEMSDLGLRTVFAQTCLSQLLG